MAGNITQATAHHSFNILAAGQAPPAPKLAFGAVAFRASARLTFSSRRSEEWPLPVHGSWQPGGKWLRQAPPPAPELSALLLPRDGYNAGRSAIAIGRHPKEASRPLRSPSQHEGSSEEDRALGKLSSGVAAPLHLPRGIRRLGAPAFHRRAPFAPAPRSGHGRKQ